MQAHARLQGTLETSFCTEDNEAAEEKLTEAMHDMSVHSVSDFYVRTRPGHQVSWQHKIDGASHFAVTMQQAMKLVWATPIEYPDYQDVVLRAHDSLDLFVKDRHGEEKALTLAMQANGEIIWVNPEPPRTEEQVPHQQPLTAEQSKAYDLLSNSSGGKEWALLWPFRFFDAASMALAPPWVQQERQNEIRRVGQFSRWKAYRLYRAEFGAYQETIMTADEFFAHKETSYDLRWATGPDDEIVWSGWWKDIPKTSFEEEVCHLMRRPWSSIKARHSPQTSQEEHKEKIELYRQHLQKTSDRQISWEDARMSLYNKEIMVEHISMQKMLALSIIGEEGTLDDQQESELTDIRVRMHMEDIDNQHAAEIGWEDALMSMHSHEDPSTTKHEWSLLMDGPIYNPASKFTLGQIASFVNGMPGSSAEPFRPSSGLASQQVAIMYDVNKAFDVVSPITVLRHYNESGQSQDIPYLAPPLAAAAHDEDNVRREIIFSSQESVASQSGIANDARRAPPIIGHPTRDMSRIFRSNQDGQSPQANDQEEGQSLSRFIA